MVDTKEDPKVANPYARLALGKCFKCNQLGHRSSNCPLRKAVHLTERDNEDENEVCCDPDGYGEKEEDYEDEDEGEGAKLYGEEIDVDTQARGEYLASSIVPN